MRGAFHPIASTRSRACLALLAAALCACGRRDEPAGPPLDKKAPQLPRLYDGRTLEEWRGIYARAPAPLKAQAAFALAELETDAAAAEPVLLLLLSDTDPGVQLAAVEAAGRLGSASPEVAGRVLDLLASRHEALRARARATLPRMGAVGLEAVRARGLASPEVLVRWGSLVVLDAMGEAAAAATDAVAVLAETDPDPSVRSQAAFTMARLGPDGARTVAAWLSDPARRDLASRALVRARGAAVPALREHLGASDEDVVRSSARTLAQIGPDAAPAIEELLALLRAGSGASREAGDALVAIGAAAVPGLRGLLDAERGAARAEARRCLELLGEGDG